MNEKVRFTNEQEDAGAREVAQLEKGRADDFAREISAMKRRLRQFFAAVDYLTFPDVDNAPPYAADPLNYIISGALPEAVEEEIGQDDDTLELPVLVVENDVSPEGDLVIDAEVSQMDKSFATPAPEGGFDPDFDSAA